MLDRLVDDCKSADLAGIEEGDLPEVANDHGRPFSTAFKHAL
jgi:hypothetical protein